MSIACLVAACSPRPAPQSPERDPDATAHTPREEQPAPPPGAGASPGGLDEIAATRRFCESGTEAAVARGQMLLAAAHVAEADVLPNPTLSASHDRSLGAARDHETVIGIAIPLGIGGRRWLRQDAAAARHAQAELEASAERVTAALAFRRAYVEAAFARARLELLDAQTQTLRSLVEKADKLQGGGENAALDQNRLRVAAELSAVDAAAIERDLGARRAWLEAVLGAKVALAGDRPPDPAPRGGAVSPRVAALEQAARASLLEADAERRRAVPDIDVFAGYRMVGGDGVETGHGFSLGVSLPLTFFDHGQAEAQRAEAQASIATALAARERRVADAAETSARLRLSDARRTAAAIESAIELARQVERGSERLYLAGEGDLSDVLQAARNRSDLEKARIDLAEAVADANLSLADARGRFAEQELNAACDGAPPPGGGAR